MTILPIPPKTDDTLRIERVLLGGLLHSPDALAHVGARLDAADFYGDAHQRIFRAVMGLWANGQPVNLETLANELATRGDIPELGGYGILGELWECDPTGGNCCYACEAVKERSTLRRLKAAAEEITTLAASPTGPADEMLSQAEGLIFRIADGRAAETLVPASAAVAEAYDRLDAYVTRQGIPDGVRTGFTDLDAKLVGLPAGNLILVGARPACGKTTLGLSMANNIARDGTGVLFASLEMTRGELTERLLCAGATVDSNRLRRGVLAADERQRIADTGDQLSRGGLWIDDAASQSVLRIASAARRLKLRNGLAAVFIDYLQLVEPESRREARWEQVGGISRRLKALAKDLAVPVVAMVQLNRASEDRADQRPRLSDLRESGSLEQDADTVLLLHRPANVENVCEVIIAKQRNGPTGDVSLYYQREFTRFADLAFGR
jgi:replicative DNA helicase